MSSTLLPLPREARDTVFLLMVIAWIIAPAASHVPVWTSVLAVALLLWRGWMAVHNLALPQRKWLLGLLLLATVATYWSHQRLLGRDPGVTMVVLLLVLKTLEMRGHRDIFVLFFLGFFVLLSNFFYSQSLPIAGSMLVGLMGLLSALVNSHRPVGNPSLWSSMRTAGMLTLLGTPIMVVFFALFPRIAPLWGVPADAMGGRSGLSATMQIGNLASLALDSSVALRVQFEGDVPRQTDLYFRGPVLSRFDGREWLPMAPLRPNAAKALANLRTQASPVRYRITQEPNHQPWLLVLDAAAQPPSLTDYQPVMSADLQWTVDRPLDELVRFSAVSYPTFTHGPDTANASLQPYLQLPLGFNPRTLQWAASWRAEPRLATATPTALVNEALRQLRTGGYRYTLDPGVFGTHTADEFWFDKRAGFCEHIASSFVILMRALQIPARVVTGYQGGERNAIDDYWTVRQSDAHAWAEVWLQGQGWVRVDPTSAVAPARIGSLERLVPPQNPLAQALGTVISQRFALNLRASWEALNNRWNQWVLNYSNAQQMDLLRNLGFETPSWAELSYVLIAIIICAAGIGALWALFERRQHDPWLRLLGRAQTRLRDAGLALDTVTPPRTMAQCLHTLEGLSTSDQQRLADWLLQLEQWRYAGGAASKARSSDAASAAQHRKSLATLQREFARLPWPAPLRP